MHRPRWRRKPAQKVTASSLPQMHVSVKQVAVLTQQTFSGWVGIVTAEDGGYIGLGIE